MTDTTDTTTTDTTTTEGQVFEDQPTPEDKPTPAANGDHESALKEAIELVQGLNLGPVDMADPDEDEDDESVTFVRNGWVRFTIAGKRHKLRRPFMGELQDLETHLEADNDRIHEINAENKKALGALRERANAIQVEAKDLPFDSIRKAELDEEATKIYAEVMRTQRALTRKAEEMRADWWRHVFEVLTPPANAKPEQMPSWIGDPGFQGRVMQHWRLVPLAHGG